MAMTTFSYVSTVLTQVNITKPCLIGGLSTGLHCGKIFDQRGDHVCGNIKSL